MKPEGHDSGNKPNALKSPARALPAPWWLQLLFWVSLALISPLLAFVLLTTVGSTVTFLVVCWPFGILFTLCLFFFISFFETP